MRPVGLADAGRGRRASAPARERARGPRRPRMNKAILGLRRERDEIALAQDAERRLCSLSHGALVECDQTSVAPRAPQDASRHEIVGRDVNV